MTSRERLPRKIHLTEVGPRDGLQNEATPIPTHAKVEFINLLTSAGPPEIEVSSFVSPKWVPQLGDAQELFSRITRGRDSSGRDIAYTALVPNDKGLARALELGSNRPDRIAVFTAASETFSRKNTNATISETLERFWPVVETCRSESLPVRAYISCVVACPYEGRMDPAQVRRVLDGLLQLGLDPDRDDIDLGETIGVAVPSDIDRLYDGLRGLVAPHQTTLHLHDTRGTALACAYRAMQLGVTRFDASCGGLGGCPYAPGAAGNLATEDLVYLCEGLGIETGVSLPRLFEAARFVHGAIGRELPGRVYRADGACRACPAGS